MRALMLAATFAFVALAPVAEAQVPVPKPITPTLEIEVGPTDSLFPPGKTTEVPVVVVYMVRVGGRADAMTLEVTTSDMAPWTFTVDPAESSFEVPPGVDVKVEIPGMLHVAPGADARAFEPLEVVLHARTAGNELASPVSAEHAFSVAADWRPALRIEIADANLPVSFGRGEGHGVVFNDGNAPITVRAEPVDAPESCTLAPLPALDFAMVESGAFALTGVAGPVALSVECGLGWDPGALSVRFEQVATERPDRVGPSVTAVWDVVTPKMAEERGPQPRSFESEPVASPAGALVGALLALASAVLVRRPG